MRVTQAERESLQAVAVAHFAVCSGSGAVEQDVECQNSASSGKGLWIRGQQQLPARKLSCALLYDMTAKAASQQQPSQSTPEAGSCYAPTNNVQDVLLGAQ